MGGFTVDEKGWIWFASYVRRPPNPREESAIYAILPQLGRKQGIDVPVVMCEGGAKGALEAFNVFSITDERISDFRKRRAEEECNSLRLFEEGGSKSPMLARIESRRAR